MIGTFFSKIFRSVGIGQATSPSRRATRCIAIEPLETRRLLAVTGSLSGFAYLDVHDLGQKDADEAGFAGMTVRLKSVGAGGTLTDVTGVGPTQTLSDGSYSFTGLAAGTYQIQVSPSSKLLMGSPSAGTAGGTVGVNQIQVQLAVDQSAADYNFAVLGAQPNMVSLRMFLASTGSLGEFLASLHDEPTVAPDAGSSASYSTIYTTGGAGVAIVASNATIASTDSPTLASMTITIQNPQDGNGELLSADTTGTSLASNYANGVLSVTGVADVANYQTVLRSVKYRINASNAHLGDRTISIVVHDGTAASTAATSTVTVVQGTGPSGYTVAANQSLIGASAAASTGITISNALVGATYNYTVSSSGGGTPVTGSGSVTSATQSITGINVSSLSDGTLTYSVTLTDGGGQTGAPATATATLDKTAPSGYGVTASPAVVNSTTATTAGFVFSSAAVGSTYNYTISSSGGGAPVTGSGTVTSATQSVAGISVSSLPDGTLTFSVTLTDPAGNVGPAATSTATLDRTAPSGYTIAANQATIATGGVSNAGFTFAGATVGTTYNYTVSSGGGGTPVTGSGTVASATQNISGINVGGLSDGTLTYSVTLTDAAGNIGAAATATASLDKTLPAGYSIAAVPSALNASTAAAAGFRFTAAEVGATYNYTISSSGGGTPVTGSGTVASATQTVTGINVTGLGSGTLTYSVVLTDPAGNAGTAATTTGVLDRTAPSGYTITANQALVNIPARTNTGFTFAGAEVGATYAFTVTSSGGAGSVTGSGTVTSATQQVSGVNVSSLPDGTLTFSVTLTDPAGNAGAATTATTVLNTVAPTGYSIAADQSLLNAGQAVAASFTFAGATIGTTYDFTVTSSGGAGSVIGSGTVTSATQQVSGINVSSLPDGTLTYSVRLTNAIGNPGAAATATTTLDKTAPSGYTISGVPAALNAAAATSAGFKFTAAEVGATYHVSISSSAGGSPVTGTGTVTSATQTVSGFDVSSFADSTLTYSVTLTDAAGNVGAAATTTVALDRTAPSGYSITPKTAIINLAAATNTGFTFGGAEVGATYHFTATTSGLGSVTGSGTVTSATQAVNGIDVSSLPDGLLTFSVILTDPAGNSGSAATTTATLDRSVPTGYTIAADQAVLGPINYTAASFTISGAVVGHTYQYSISSSGGGTAITGSGAITSATQQVSPINVSSLPGGTLTYLVSLTNPVGNTGAGATATAALDKTAPSGYSIAANPAVLNAANTLAGFNLTGGTVGSTYNVSITSSGGGAAVTGSGNVTAATQTVSGINVSSLGDGTLTISVTLTDPVGNTGFAATAGASLDRAAPSGYSITLDTAALNAGTAANTGFTLTGGETGTTFVYTITSSGGGTAVIGSGTVTSASHHVGSVNVTSLPSGNLTWSVQLTDAAGNAGAAATATGTLDRSAPSGYSITSDSSTYGAASATLAGFTFSGAEVGTTYNYTITSNNGGGPITGSGTVTSTTQHVTGINLTPKTGRLADGVVTFSVTLTDAANNTGSAATATANLDTVAPAEFTVTPDKATYTQADNTNVGFQISGAEVGTTYNYVFLLNGVASSVRGNGPVTASSMHFTGINISSLPSGVFTLHVILTDSAGNGVAENAQVTHNKPVPAFTISAAPATVNAGNATNVGFTFSGATSNATYAYTITSSGGAGSVTGSGSLFSATQSVSGINVSGLPNGTLTYSVVVTDGVGNVSPAVTTTALLDKTAPSGYTVASDLATYNASTAVNAGFTFAAAELGSQYSYTIASVADPAAKVQGSGTIASASQHVSGINISSLPDGAISFSVTLRDAAGNTGSAALASATLDKTAPSGYAIAADLGAIGAATATNTGFTFTGAEVSASYNFSVTSSGGAGSVTGSGTVTSATQHVGGINVAGLPDGLLTFSVILTDPNGNASSAATATATLDKVAPAGYSVSPVDPILTTALMGSTGFKFQAAETGTNYAFTITSSGGGTPVTGSGSVTAAGQTVSGINLSGLNDGTVSFSVVLTDIAGNPGAAATTTATLDRLAPVGYSIAALPDKINANTVGAAGFAFSGATIGATYNFTVTSSGGGGSVTGSGTITAASQAVSGINVASLPNGTLTFSAALSQGVHQGVAVTATALLDTVAPSGFSIASDRATINFIAVASAGFVFAGAEVGTTYQYNISDNALAVTGSGTISSASQHVSGIDLSPLADGLVTFSVTLTDPAGNVSNVATATATIDRLVPAAIALSTSVAPDNAPIGSPVGVLQTAGPQSAASYTYSLVAGAGGDDNGSFQIGSDNELQTGAVFNGIVKSTYQIRIRSTDAQGKFIEQPFVITVSNSDPITPTVAIDGSSVGQNLPSGQLVGSFSTVVGTSGILGSQIGYTLVPGVGSDNNNLFTVANGQLRTAGSLAPGVYTVRVRSSSTFLLSDVVDLDGITSPYAFQMAYDSNVLPSGNYSLLAASAGLISLASTSGGAWYPGVALNGNVAGSLAVPNYLGSYASFWSSVTTANPSATLNDVLGSAGVNLAAHTAWAVVDRPGEYAVAATVFTEQIFTVNVI